MAKNHIKYVLWRSWHIYQIGVRGVISVNFGVLDMKRFENHWLTVDQGFSKWKTLWVPLAGSKSVIPKLFSQWPKREARYLPGTQTSENSRSTSSQRVASRHVESLISYFHYLLNLCFLIYGIPWMCFICSRNYLETSFNLVLMEMFWNDDLLKTKKM